MIQRIDTVVVGAGVVGLAIARELALRGREVIVLETADAIGTGTSSRNSEVIHAGIYYPAGTLKARLCVTGRDRLYDYCASRGIQHRRMGKLLVATRPGETMVLDEYQALAQNNGAGQLEPLTAAQVRALEPEVECLGGLYSPHSGIIDSHGLMLALQADLEASGGQLVLRSPLLRGEVTPAGIRLDVGGAAPTRLVADRVVLSAGLECQSLARRINGLPAASIPPGYYAKGHYYALAGRSPFHHLVYPVAGHGGLGVHVTLDLAGQARFGPDVEWIDGIDYGFDDRRRATFEAAIRCYYPALDPARLSPAYAGIRPKLVAEGHPAADFLVHGPRDHGVAGLVALYGIESPGLTAALALAEHAATLLQ